MPYATWLADALRAGGCKVREEPGWKTRGHGGMSDLRGVLCHHTGSASMPGARNVVRDGRTGLAGPLAQLTLDPDGTFSVIAAGQSWHAGSGGPLLGCPANQGNAHLIGIEGVSNGSYWTPEQRAEYPRGVAALIRHMGARTPNGWVAAHKEWAPGRKVDPGNWDMNQFRADVARHLGTEDNDMTGEQDKMLREVHGHLVATAWKGLPGSNKLNPGTGTVVEMTANTNWELRESVKKDLASLKADFEEFKAAVLEALKPQA